MAIDCSHENCFFFVSSKSTKVQRVDIRSPKTVARTVAIMREILARTGDYGCPAAEASVPGRPPRHARALYLCSPAALGTVLRAREALGPLAARVEVRDLPPGALLP